MQDIPRLSAAQILASLLIPTVVILLGGTCLWWLTDGAHSWGRFVYFALVTVTTVGFGELPDLEEYPGARVVTAGLIVTGVSAIAFFQSIMTALIVQRVVVSAFWRRPMQKRINQLRGHVIVAGAGRTGRFVIGEYAARGEAIVAIDSHEAALEELRADLGNQLLYVVGDATHDSVLHAAGAERASGLITALSDERDNLFVTISFRAINPGARIVAKAVEVQNEAKLLHAGADAVVSPHRIGGHRLVGEYTHPTVTQFLDEVMTGDAKLRFEEIVIAPGAPCAEKQLGALQIHDETGAFVIALRRAEGGFVYNPPEHHTVGVGDVLIVLGDRASVGKLKKVLGLPA